MIGPNLSYTALEEVAKIKSLVQMCASDSQHVFSGGPWKLTRITFCSEMGNANLGGTIPNALFETPNLIALYVHLCPLHRHPPSITNNVVAIGICRRINSRVRFRRLYRRHPDSPTCALVPLRFVLLVFNLTCFLQGPL